MTLNRVEREVSSQFSASDADEDLCNADRRAARSCGTDTMRLERLANQMKRLTEALESQLESQLTGECPTRRSYSKEDVAVGPRASGDSASSSRPTTAPAQGKKRVDDTNVRSGTGSPSQWKRQNSDEILHQLEEAVGNSYFLEEYLPDRASSELADGATAEFQRHLEAHEARLQTLERRMDNAEANGTALDRFLAELREKLRPMLQSELAAFLADEGSALAGRLANESRKVVTEQLQAVARDAAEQNSKASAVNGYCAVERSPPPAVRFPTAGGSLALPLASFAPRVSHEGIQSVASYVSRESVASTTVPLAVTHYREPERLISPGRHAASPTIYSPGALSIAASPTRSGYNTPLAVPRSIPCVISSPLPSTRSSPAGSLRGGGSLRVGPGGGLGAEFGRPISARSLAPPVAMPVLAPATYAVSSTRATVPSATTAPPVAVAASAQERVMPRTMQPRDVPVKEGDEDQETRHSRLTLLEGRLQALEDEVKLK